jgi:hypothetical protein
VARYRRSRHADTVTKSTLITIVAVIVLLGFGALLLFTAITRAEFTSPGSRREVKNPPATSQRGTQPFVGSNQPPAPGAAGSAALSVAEKNARVEKIKRDYEEIRGKASAEYSAAGANFPGGLNAFLHQLGLLEREKRADLAKILSPDELENLELRETSAGQLVQRLLGGTNATDEQRRAVFRLQREFEDRFALTFDVAPAALFTREAARQQNQEKIRAVLGDQLFGAWLADEGGDYASFAAFAQRERLAATLPLELWRAKNEFALRRLELGTNAGFSAEQRTAATKQVAQEIEARLMNLVGGGAWHAARSEVLHWLPRR